MVFFFSLSNAQNALVLLQEDDPLIRIKSDEWSAKNEKDEWEEKKVLELCNSERFNIRRQEVEQYWNRVIRSKKRGEGAPIAPPYYTQACMVCALDALDAIPSGNYDVLSRDEYRGYMNKHDNKKVYYIIIGKEGVKYYSERTDFPPFWDNFNFTSIESDMHKELRKKYEPMLKKQRHEDVCTDLEYKSVARRGLMDSKAWNNLTNQEKELYKNTYETNYWTWEK